jgi:ABC-2 type transport system ATP-binding protein
MEPVVSLNSVSVRYGLTWALRDVTAAFPGGAVGLLGPNGAGKSTMIKSLLGLVTPDRGEMRVLGLDVRTAPLQIRTRIGYMPETDAHIPGMNAVSFVAYCGELAGLHGPTRCSGRTRCCTMSASAKRGTATPKPTPRA